MTLLGLGLVAALLSVATLAGRERLRPAPWGVLLGLYLAPAVFVALLVWLAPADAHRLRLGLLGVGFRGSADEVLEVRVGGDRAEHEVWISAFAPDDDEEPPPPAGSVRFDPHTVGDPERGERAVAGEGGGPTEEEADEAPDGGARAVDAEEPRPFRAVAGDGAGGLLAVDMDGTPQPVAARPLVEGDRLIVGGTTWTVHRSALPWKPPAALVPEGAGPPVELPRRTQRVPVVGWEVPLPGVYGSGRQTYPLPVVSASPAGASGAAPPLLFFEPEGLAGGRLFLLAAPGTVRVERGGEVLEPPAPVSFPSGRRLRVLSPPRPSDDSALAGGLRDRRSFRVVAGERSTAFLYDTREVHSLGPAELDALRLDTRSGEGGELASRRVGLSLGSWQVVERSLHLRHASDAVASEGMASLELPQSLLARWRLWPAELDAATPRGTITGRFGAPLWLGDRHAAAVQIDVLRPPLALALLGLLLAVAKAATARAVRLPAAAAVAAAGLEGLVALRLLLGYRVWAGEPHRPEAMELALVAWSLLPWVFLAASAPAEEDEDGRWRAWLLPVCGVLFSLVWCLRIGGDGLRLWAWGGCHLAALAVPVGRRLLAGRLRLSLAARVGAHPVWAWSLGALMFLGVRGALLLFGFRESLQLGQRFALSLAHVPAAVLLEAGYLAWLWHRGRSRGRLTAVDLVPALAVILGVWALPAFLVSDLGLALLGLPVFLVALVVLLLALRREGVRITVDEHRRPEPGRQAWLRRGALRGVAAALVLVVGGYVLAIASPLGARALVTAIPEDWRLELESERNFLRLLGFAYPDELARVGRRTSEEMATMAAVMGAYTGGPVEGRGWFGSEWSPHIAATALREHVPSVYVAGEWGLAGTVGLVALYFLVAWGGAGARPWSGGGARAGRHGEAEDTPFAGIAAALAAGTLTMGGVYMVAANYRLTLFTGKNAYLLGLDSTADVLESFALVLIVAAGLSVARGREVPR